MRKGPRRRLKRTRKFRLTVRQPRRTNLSRNLRGCGAQVAPTVSRFQSTVDRKTSAGVFHNSRRTAYRRQLPRRVYLEIHGRCLSNEIFDWDGRLVSMEQESKFFFSILYNRTQLTWNRDLFYLCRRKRLP